MSVSFSQIRSAISTQIKTISGFNESRFPPAFIGRGPAPLSHLSYSVGIDTSVERGGRQSPTQGVELFTTVQVVFAYRLKPTSIYPEGYDLALNQERDLILKILSSYQSIQSGLQIKYIRSQREFLEALEYSLHDIEFQITHSIS